MTTTTVSISNTRASLRKLAAQNGWVLAIASENDVDVFVRGDREVKTAFRSFGASNGTFLAGFLVAPNPPAELVDQGFDGIIADGGVAKVRGWLKAAV